MSNTGINTDRTYITNRKQVFFPVKSLITGWLDLNCLTWMHSEWAKSAKVNCEYPIFFLEISNIAQRVKMFEGQLEAIMVGEGNEEIPIGIGFYDSKVIDADEAYEQLGQRLFNYLLVTEKYEILDWISKHDDIQQTRSSS